jgi:hypothetical protein
MYELDVIIEDTTFGTVQGSGSYAAMEHVHLQIVLFEKVVFDGWSIDGTIVSLNPDFDYTMPDHAVTIIAQAHRIETMVIERLNMLLPPTTLYYYPGMEFSIDGLVVEIEYTNGDKEIANNDEFEIIWPSFDLEKAYTVTLHYEGFTTYFLVYYEEIEIQLNTLVTIVVVDGTVDFYFGINNDDSRDGSYLVEISNPAIAEVTVDPDYPQHAVITGCQAGKTQVVITLLSNPAISQTVEINVVEALPPNEGENWPSEYLDLILNDLAPELTPFVGTTYTYTPSQIYGDYYSFDIHNLIDPLDVVAYAYSMEAKGWTINRYISNTAVITKDNVRVSFSYDEVTNNANLYIAKKGHDFLSPPMKDDLLEIISGKIHEDVSGLFLPDYLFYEISPSLYGWQDPLSEYILMYGYTMNDPLFTAAAYVDELLNLGFTTLESNGATWYLSPSETYMMRFSAYETHVEMVIQSIDYYLDFSHINHDSDIYRP